MPVVYSKKGKPVDFGLLQQSNEKIIAAGNAKLNARGDKIGKRGKIIETAEEIQRKYDAMQAYSQSSQTVKQLNPDEYKIMTPQEADKKARQEKMKKINDEKHEAQMINNTIIDHQGPSVPTKTPESTKPSDSELVADNNEDIKQPKSKRTVKKV